MTDDGVASRLYECDRCEMVVLRNDGAARCAHDIEAVERTTAGIEEPALEDVLRLAFGMSPTELEVCICVMEMGETTTSELAAELDVDRSSVSRHLNHLADLDILEKRRFIREGGGEVYGYRPNSVEAVRRGLKAGFHAWVAEALGQIEAISREKVESIVEGSEETLRVYRQP